MGVLHSKMALVTSAFHLAIAILLEAVLMGVTFAKGGLMYSLFLQGLGSRLSTDLAGFLHRRPSLD